MLAATRNCIKMKELPSCLLKRYRALDEVIRDLRTVTERAPPHPNCDCGCRSDRGIKLMCEFWNMLKDDPNFDVKVRNKGLLTEF